MTWSCPICGKNFALVGLHRCSRNAVKRRERELRQVEEDQDDYRPYSGDVESVIENMDDVEDQC